MSITTRQGDGGQTRLFSGELVPKDAPRPCTYGDLDELVSLLGVARQFCRHDATRDAVLAVQRTLFVLGSEIATSPAGYDRLPRRIDAALMAELDRCRDELEARIVLPRSFVIPAGSQAAAFLDLARTVARRLERGMVTLHRAGELPNDLALVWINRLSDYLFLLARSEEDTITPLKPT
jgi:cob(I)alamin adenosyltransferase